MTSTKIVSSEAPESSLRIEAVARQRAVFMQAVLNSVNAEIAVLNAGGIIVAVNESWERFARANNTWTEVGKAPNGIGTNYLAACRSSGQTCPDALLACDGIEQVLAGTLTCFTHEYSCHSPDQQRWFSMCVLPLGTRPSAGVTITHTDITAHKLAEEELRIAAVAFEVQDAIVVLNDRRQILRVNQAFIRITGYSRQEVLGKTTDFLWSNRCPASRYDDLWSEVLDKGLTRGSRWLRHKNGENFFAQGATMAVKDNDGQTTHYVIIFSDQTLKHEQDQQRMQHEAAQRAALVREVHHRINNNLQGIRGLLAQLARQRPEIAESLQLAIGHLNGISIIHGLQGRRDQSKVRLCELTREITQATSALWQTEIHVSIPEDWVVRVVAEEETVATALIIQELIVNAIKHGGKADGHVAIALRQGRGVEGVEWELVNTGCLQGRQDEASPRDHGLQLVESLSPHAGLQITWEQRGDQVLTRMDFSAPLVRLEQEH